MFKNTNSNVRIKVQFDSDCQKGKLPDKKRSSMNQIEYFDNEEIEDDTKVNLVKNAKNDIDQDMNDVEVEIPHFNISSNPLPINQNDEITMISEVQNKEYKDEVEIQSDIVNAWKLVKKIRKNYARRRINIERERVKFFDKLKKNLNKEKDQLK